jgi:hypothetical protein
MGYQKKRRMKKMTIFGRIKNIWKSEHASTTEISVPAEPLKTAQVGDIVTIEMEEYIIIGKTSYYDRGHEPHRIAYNLRQGTGVYCLVVEIGRTNETFICDFIEGSLDDPHDVPTQMVIDGTTYLLENYQTDLTSVIGNTDFRNNEEVTIWRYHCAEEETHFFLQWQEGKIVAIEGHRVPNADVQFMNQKKS